MNLEEFRKALSSDATEENAQLKRQLSDLQTEYHEKLSNFMQSMLYSYERCYLSILWSRLPLPSYAGA